LEPSRHFVLPPRVSGAVLDHVHDPPVAEILDTFTNITMPLVPGDVVGQRLPGIEPHDTAPVRTRAFLGEGNEPVAEPCPPRRSNHSVWRSSAIFVSRRMAGKRNARARLSAKFASVSPKPCACAHGATAEVNTSNSWSILRMSPASRPSVPSITQTSSLRRI